MTNKNKITMFRNLPPDQSKPIYIPFAAVNGKTTLANALRKAGYIVFEEHEVFKLDLSQSDLDRLLHKVKLLKIQPSSELIELARSAGVNINVILKIVRESGMLKT